MSGSAGALCVWLDASSLVLCQQSPLLVSQPASDEISQPYLNHLFKLLPLSWLILAEVDQGLFRRVMGVLAEVLLDTIASNFFCWQSEHLCTSQLVVKPVGKKQLAQYIWGLSSPFFTRVFGSGVGTCSNTQLWCFPAEPVKLKALQPYRLDSHFQGFFLQCLENQWRGFFRMCEDLSSGL